METPDPDMQLGDALRLFQTGELRQAEQIYRDILASYPETPDAWNMLAIVSYERNELEAAAIAAERATELRPGIAPYWLTRGNIEMARNLYRAAQTSLAWAVRLEPGFAQAQYRLGLSYHREARYAEAVAAYRSAQRLAPDVAEIHWSLAEALLARGEVNEAMHAYHEAFARDPEGVLDRRGCLDCMGRLRFDSLPPFWLSEIERFFRRQGLEKKPYVKAGLKALKTKTSFKRVLMRGSSDVPDAFDECALREVLSDGLFHVLLRDALIADAQFERFLTNLRRLLLETSLRGSAPLELLCSLALQCFNNEFVYAITAAEESTIETLAREVEDKLESVPPLDEATSRALLVLAAYRRLVDVRGIDHVLALTVAPSFACLLQRSVHDLRTERALRAQIATIGKTTDAVSRAVRGMYEEHPYPRWFAMDRAPPIPLSDWVARELPFGEPLARRSPVRILVAGCGTGRDAIWLATNIADSSVFAVDLSLSSLSHAKRMADTLAVGNIEFRQGDILELGCLDERFDLIASTGVLHHMREPRAGLASLAALLRPGGLMKLGFYSARARVSVSAARELIEKQQIPATEAGIRKFRQHVLGAPETSPLGELRYADDLYSMSMCRDLLFHVQEHQYRLPQIEAMLHEVGLRFLGLSELPSGTAARYRSLFPNDDGMVNVANWDRYEERYPDTFSHMFLLWCGAAAGGP